ncbi:non-ribosomal peptide synthetase [Pseudophaeobacter flagellatus]|uniref:non-ribosomal peptide synthetase n=1 Tax=Pseudophaeobacter flagellatus TaxID=2899119 RepID=UPI001E619B3B|nr:AMP-binding protein [Pseudophaeobacter flagellatus]
MTHFGAQLRAGLKLRADLPALICDDLGPLSGTTCLVAMDQLRAGLAAADLPAGSRIAIIAPQPRHAALAFVACLQSHVAAPLNPDYTRDEFLFYLNDLQPGLVLLGAGATAAAEAAVASCGLPSLRLGDEVFQAAQKASQLGVVGGRLPALSAAAAPGLILHTSGTTARPKMVALSQENLACSGTNIAGSLRLGEEDISLCAMPLFHIHGLMACLGAALVAGGAVVLAGRFQPERFVDCLLRHRPTWFSAVPTLHLALMHHLEQRAAPMDHALRFIRSSSAPLPPSIIARLEGYFDAPVIEAYGMTEASHQIASNPLPPAVRKPGTVGQAFGTSIAILNDHGTACAPGAVGNVVITGAGVTPGYVENPSANLEAFQPTGFWTGDLGSLDKDGYLRLTGRCKEIVNRGGQKISPREIDEALIAIPGITDAVAFAQPHASLGEDLLAAVCLAPGADLTGEAIRLRLFERLADYKVPSQIALVDAIPVGATGKRQRLQMWSALQGYFSAPMRAPVTSVEIILCEFTAEILGQERMGLDDNFFNLGGNSILGVELSITLGELLGCYIPPIVIFRHPTPAGLSAFVLGRLSDQDLAQLDQVVRSLAEVEGAAGT